MAPGTYPAGLQSFRSTLKAVFHTATTSGFPPWPPDGPPLRSPWPSTKSKLAAVGAVYDRAILPESTNTRGHRPRLQQRRPINEQSISCSSGNSDSVDRRLHGVSADSCAEYELLCDKLESKRRQSRRTDRRGCGLSIPCPCGRCGRQDLACI